MVHHPIHEACRDHGISQVVAELLETYVRCQDRGSFAVTAIDDLEEKGCVSARFLFQAVETDLVDKEDLRLGVCFELALDRAVAKGGHEIAEHAGCGCVAARKELAASEQKERLGDMAFTIM